MHGSSTPQATPTSPAELHRSLSNSNRRDPLANASHHNSQLDAVFPSHLDVGRPLSPTHHAAVARKFENLRVASPPNNKKRERAHSATPQLPSKISRTQEVEIADTDSPISNNPAVHSYSQASPLDEKQLQHLPHHHHQPWRDSQYQSPLARPDPMPPPHQLSRLGKYLGTPGMHKESSRYVEEIEEDEVLIPNAYLIPQPDSKPISPKQLVDEVKSIYAGLVMVEAKCIGVINSQTAALRRMLDGAPVPEGQKPYQDHFQPLVAIHRTLLHEHHDFFLASQHPTASLALRELASKYSMPARMWKHGIHNFLELLRQRLPHSIEMMLAFIYLAYEMVGLLYETVPTFVETWIECLGDLARYRMAIEEEDVRDRDVWTGVARGWYQKAIDRNPTIGRLYHHQAILARNMPFQQLGLYSRSLTAITPFPNTRESILTLLEPTMARSEEQQQNKNQNQAQQQTHAIEVAFVAGHGFLFTTRDASAPSSAFFRCSSAFVKLLDGHITKVTARFKEHGVCIFFAIMAGILQYGDENSRVRRMFLAREPDQKAPERADDKFPSEDPSECVADHSFVWLCDVMAVVVRRRGDLNVAPFVHVSLLFVLHLVEQCPDLFPLERVPWEELCHYINSLCRPYRMSSRVERVNHFPVPPALKPTRNAAGVGPPPKDMEDPATTERLARFRPLPEDFALLGQVFSQDYLPKGWCELITEDDELRSHALERPEVNVLRADRIMWLGCRLAKSALERNAGVRLGYDYDTRRFTCRAPIAT